MRITSEQAISHLEEVVGEGRTAMDVLCIVAIKRLIYAADAVVNGDDPDILLPDGGRVVLLAETLHGDP